MDRTIKLHQREFEILPEAWAKLLVCKVIEHEMNLENPHDKTLREHSLKLMKEGEDIRKGLEALVQDRLWDSQTTTNPETSPLQLS
jgi:hypothetical protein